MLIKQKQTVLRYYSLVNCIQPKKLTVLPKHVNPSINVATNENTHYNFKLFDRSCSQKVISIWQDVWGNGKIAVHRRDVDERYMYINFYVFFLHTIITLYRRSHTDHILLYLFHCTL